MKSWFAIQDPFPVDVLPDFLDWMTAIGTIGAVTVAVGVAITEAVRAKRANNERDETIEGQRAKDRRATARLVSSWVEQLYLPSDDNTHYVRQVFVHIINESDSPVFRLAPSVSLLPAIDGTSKSVQIGPLSMPSLIPVLPPRRELIFDISRPLLAHVDSEAEDGSAPDIPGVEISFTDSNDVRWVRELDGLLVESDRLVGELVESPKSDEAERQLGKMTPLNPMAVVLGFLSLIGDEEKSNAQVLDEIKILLSPLAEGWKGLDEDGVQALRADLSDYGLATFVNYPVSNIAYVRIVKSVGENPAVVSGEGMVIPGKKVVTLVFTSDFGWRIFTYGGGGTRPDQIEFVDGID